ncbi:MAG: hypothetical protein ACRCZP_09435 [Phycicoccus sp.]
MSTSVDALRVRVNTGGHVVDATPGANYVGAMPTKTPTEQLAELLLSEPLRDWALRLRRAGESWPAISRALSGATNGRVKVTGEYLRQLYGPPAQTRPARDEATP